MWPNPQFPADLVPFTEEIFNGNFIFCAVVSLQTSVKVRCFSDTSINDMYFNHNLLLRKKPAAVVLHMGTNNFSDLR